MNQNILSRSACNALRGLAIIGIFLHNYCHWLGPIVKENEYQFFQTSTCLSICCRSSVITECPYSSS